MAISRARAQDYAESVINRPRGEMPVTLRRHKNGVTLLYRGRALTKTHATKVGEVQAELMAEVLGVERGSWPQQDLVWGRMAGGPLEKTGIIAGMSGSPVYIEGRLLGAVAYGWGTATEPLCGITPIGEMLTALERQEQQPPGSGAGVGSGGAGLWNIPQTQSREGEAPTHRLRWRRH